MWGWNKDVLGILEFRKFKCYLYMFFEIKVFNMCFRYLKKEIKERRKRVFFKWGNCCIVILGYN